MQRFFILAVLCLASTMSQAAPIVPNSGPITTPDGLSFEVVITPSDNGDILAMYIEVPKATFKVESAWLFASSTTSDLNRFNGVMEIRTTKNLFTSQFDTLSSGEAWFQIAGTQ